MTVRIINADVMDALREMPDESVHCAVTSPPYFGLRAYLPADHPDKAREIGSEPTLDEHIEKLVVVMREVRRVLRSDGICWLNYGDAYCSTAPGTMGAPLRTDGIFSGVKEKTASARVRMRPETPDGLKPKDLMLIPFRLALALQADGWWVRSRLPWLKPNGMPSSVEDRPGTSVEEIFMLTKSPRYFYDGEAIKQVAKYPAGPNAPDKVRSPQGQGFTRRNEQDARAVPPNAPLHKGLPRFGKNESLGKRQYHGFNERWESGVSDGQRAFRQVDAFFSAIGDVSGVVADGDGNMLALHVATQPFAEAHFATFPPKLIEPLILAGTSEKGCCLHCGAPFERVVEKVFVPQPDVSLACGVRGAGSQKPMAEDDGRAGFARGTTVATTVGWKQTCDCPGVDPVPCTVLDPWGGAGTTALVADRLGRDAISIELNPEYAAMQERRIARDRLERGQKTMEQVAKAKLPALPLEALMRGEP